MVVLSTGIFCSCSYDKLPPKTKDASTKYLLPEGEVPSPEEREELQSIRKEYEESIKE